MPGKTKNLIPSLDYSKLDNDKPPAQDARVTATGIPLQCSREVISNVLKQLCPGLTDIVVSGGSECLAATFTAPSAEVAAKICLKPFVQVNNEYWAMSRSTPQAKAMVHEQSLEALFQQLLDDARVDDHKEVVPKGDNPKEDEVKEIIKPPEPLKGKQPATQPSLPAPASSPSLSSSVSSSSSSSLFFPSYAAAAVNGHRGGRAGKKRKQEDRTLTGPTHFSTADFTYVEETKIKHAKPAPRMDGNDEVGA